MKRQWKKFRMKNRNRITVPDEVLFIGLFILFLILFFCGVAAYVKRERKERKTRRKIMFQMKNRWKNILVGCLTVFGILIPSLSCRAENVGSIQIEYHGRTQENEEVVFANADFSVFLSERWRMESGRLQEISVMREFLWKESNLLKKRTGKAVIQLCGSAKYTGKRFENGREWNRNDRRIRTGIVFDCPDKGVDR